MIRAAQWVLSRRGEGEASGGGGAMQMVGSRYDTNAVEAGLYYRPINAILKPVAMVLIEA
jgi:hypothetical protein